MREFLIGWLVATNVLAFVLMGFDKLSARRAPRGKSRRVPEAKLWLVAALGGAPAAWVASSLFRHKTRKSSFRTRLGIASLVCAGWIWLAWPILQP